MSIKRLSRQEKEQAVDILASAFFDYPVMRYILKDSDQLYGDHLEALLGLFCETRLTREWPLLGVEAESKLVAIAGVNEPIIKPWPQQLQTIYEELKNTIGSQAIMRLEHYDHIAHEPESPHYYLGIIAVHPDSQGQGYARKLIDEIQRMSESEPVSTGVSLSTENPQNVSIYEHMGFEVFAKSQVFDDLYTWGLFRANGK